MRSRPILYSILISALILSFSVFYTNPGKYHLPFDIKYHTLSKSMQKQVDCLTENILFEAGKESKQGQVAVALVTLNRVASGNYANDVCGVVHQKTNGVCQFSWVCQKGLRNLPQDIDARNWQQWKDSVLAAEMVLNHGIIDFTHGALKFFAHWQVNPIWAKLKDVTVVIGNHTFVK